MGLHPDTSKYYIKNVIKELEEGDFQNDENNIPMFK